MASPFSFHCMICFEEFDTERRFPVVLPCGHTYVCNQCAERLERCMECRTSLIQILPRPPTGGDALYGGRGGRWSSRPGNSPGAPPPPPIKRRLPLPKNVVLMSLIEATELAAETVRGQEQRPSLSESPNLSIPHSILDLDEVEEEKIKTGTSLAISDCGTYAIAAKEGLEIYPCRPDSVVQADRDKLEEEEVDTLVRFFHLDHKMDIVDNGHDELQPTESEYKEASPVRLSWGDRVQIVSTEAGWAKLARGYGFVRADKNQLVKVGSSVDRACKLEALLRLLSSRRKDLRTEQKRVDNHFISMMNELQVSLMSDEDLTVIAADTFHERKPKDFVEELKIDKIDLEQPLSQEVERNDKYEDSTPLKPRPMERPMTPPNAIESTRGFFCTSGDVFDAVIPLSGGSSSRRQPRALPHTSESPAIVAALARANSNGSTSTAESTPTRIFPSASVSNPSPSALRAGARAWREMHGHQPPGGDVLGGIDFRTGMSGHSALTSASSHPHDYLNPYSRTVFRGFSNHSGLTLWKTSRKSAPRGPAPNSHLAMPMHPGTHRLDEKVCLPDTS